MAVSSRMMDLKHKASMAAYLNPPLSGLKTKAMTNEEAAEHFGPQVTDRQYDTKTFEKAKRRKALKLAIYNETEAFMARIQALRAEMDK